MTSGTSILINLRYAGRALRKKWMFSAAIVLSLSLGIGINTAAFSFGKNVLIKMLPVDNPEQLMSLKQASPQGEGEAFSYPLFKDLSGGSSKVIEVFGFAMGSAAMPTKDGAERISVDLVTVNYFTAL